MTLLNTPICKGKRPQRLYQHLPQQLMTVLLRLALAFKANETFLQRLT